jgi:HK97 family phage portal protein
MTWPFGQRALTAQQLLAERTGLRTGRGSRVSREQSLQHSAVWACQRLRADLISTMPLDVYKDVNGIPDPQRKPPVLISPGGSRVLMDEWLYSTQIDLDTVGNTVGIITARDGLGLPARIELVNIDEVTFRKRDGVLKVHVGGDVYDYDEVWHERQFTRAGLSVGLSPIAYAAMTINAHLSAQEFARDWFANSATPSAHFKNNAKVLKPGETSKIKARFKEALSNGEPLVTGKDWDYSMLGAKASESGFLEQQKFSVTDVCRFLGVPADMIDAESGGSSITYANVTQRNLQLLIMNIGPAIRRRETAFSARLLPQPRYVKFNRGALLEMDLKSRYEAHGIAITNRFLAPSEARALEDRAPFTEEQEAEFARLFPNKSAQPTPTTQGGS